MISVLLQMHGSFQNIETIMLLGNLFCLIAGGSPSKNGASCLHLLVVCNCPACNFLDFDNITLELTNKKL